MELMELYQDLAIRHERSLKCRPSPNAPKLTEDEQRKLLLMEKLLTSLLAEQKRLGRARSASSERKSYEAQRKSYEAQVRWAKAEDRRNLGWYIFIGVLVTTSVICFIFGLMFM